MRNRSLGMLRIDGSEISVTSHSVPLESVNVMVASL
jgi:hypothetical protein